MKKGKEAFHNNIYALRLMWQICPGQVLHKAITRFLGYFEWLFYSAFFMRFVVKALEMGREFSAIMIFVGVTVAVFAGISLYNSYVEGTVTPVTTIIVNRELNKKLFRKSRNVELSCYEDSEFYNKYTLAMEKADERLMETVDVIWGIVFGVTASVAAFVFLLEVDRYAVLFVGFPILGNFCFNKVLGKIDFERNREMVPYNRKIAYINRVMYMTDYAKEIRLTNAFALMRRNYREAIQGLIQCTHKYTKKGMIFHWLRVIFTFSFILRGC